MRGKVLLLAFLSSLLVATGAYWFLQEFDGFNHDQVAEASIAKETGLTETVNDLEMTLNNVRVEPSDEGEEFRTIIADMTLVNKGSDVREFTLYKLTVVDEEGYAYNHVTSVETKGILGGQLHPDRKTRGEVAFQVPTTDAAYELVYTDHFRTGQVTWEIMFSE